MIELSARASSLDTKLLALLSLARPSVSQFHAFSGGSLGRTPATLEGKKEAKGEVKVGEMKRYVPVAEP